MATRFIRVNGRIVPIKDKDPSRSQMKKNYKKHGDGANQASRIDDKYESRASKGTTKFGVVAAAGALGALGFKSGKAKIAAAALGVASAVAGTMIKNRRLKKTALSKERDYVRTFGMTSEGERPLKKKPKGSGV